MNQDKQILINEVNELKVAINIMGYGVEKCSMFKEDYKGSIETLQRIKARLTTQAQKYLDTINKINDKTNNLAKKYLDFDGAGYTEDIDGITLEMVYSGAGVEDLDDYSKLNEWYSITSLNNRLAKMKKRVKK